MAPTIAKMPSRTRANLVLRGTIWYYRREVEGSDKWISTKCRDYKMAEKRASQIDTEINEHRFGFEKPAEPERVTVGAWVKKWSEGHVASLAKGSADQYAYHIAHVRDAWGSQFLDDIRESDCKALLQKLKTGSMKSQNTRRMFHGVAKACFNAAIRDRVLDENPWAFKRAKAVARTHTLSIEEQQLLWPHLPPVYKQIATVILLSGLRANEITHLERDDLQFVKSLIDVRAEIAKGHKQRYAPLWAETAAALRDRCRDIDSGDALVNLRTRRTRERIAAGVLFPFTRWTLTAAWNRASEAAGIEPFSTHDLRRTFATRCANPIDGSPAVPMKRLQEWMGHGDIKVTAEFYVQNEAAGDAAWQTTARRAFVTGTAAVVAKAVAPLRMVK